MRGHFLMMIQLHICSKNFRFLPHSSSERTDIWKFISRLAQYSQFLCRFLQPAPESNWDNYYLNIVYRVYLNPFTYGAENNRNFLTMRLRRNLIHWSHIHSVFVIRQVTIYTNELQNSLVSSFEVFLIDKLLKMSVKISFNCMFRQMNVDSKFA